MNPPVIRDIRELDPAVVPLTESLGEWWWMLASVVAVIAALALVLWLYRRVLAMEAWRSEALTELKHLRSKAKHSDPKAVAADLSQLLRRVAMARAGRQACAGLSGEQWLYWLQQNDPGHFHWTRHGQLLLSLPYAPHASEDDRKHLQRLIRATRRWVYGRRLKSQTAEAAHV